NRIFSGEFARVSGDVHIAGCPKLMDISGLPRFIDGDVSITNCPALKELNTNCHAGEVTIMRCGKRFKQAAVQKAFPCAIRIVCSEEEYEANLNEAIVNEAFQDPVLIRLYDQIRNNKKKFDLTEMFGGYARLDKISPSSRYTYKITDQKPLLKDARKILANKNRDYGFIATEDWDGNFVVFFNNQQSIYWLKEGGFPGSYYGTDFERIESVTPLLDMLKPGGRYSNDVKLVHIWFLSSDRYQVTVDRRNNREGMIDPRNEEQMRQMLKEQRKRYARIVKSLKEARKSEQYKAITDKVDKIMARFSKFMNKVIADPSWAAANSWRFSGVFNSIRQGYVRGASTQKYGVIYAFQNWSDAVVRALSQSEYSYGTTNTAELEAAIAWADKELTGAGL
ncbi:MAG: hypothetical protein K2N48_06375, partial [Muribaculaceae bacterium]|nr:hypothetical protein [Muribaculaceae bacterium]